MKQSQMQPDIRRYFTLLELMVVLVLASMLMLIALPAFESIISGNAVKASSSHVGSLIQLGRQYAISQRRPVAIVMPGDEGTSIPEEHKFRVVRLAYIEKTSSGTYDFVDWVPASKWLYMPVGALIMEVDQDIGIQDNVTYSNNPMDNGATTIDKVDLSAALGGNASIDNVRCIIFASTGRIIGNGLHVTIGEAAFANGYWIIKRAADTPTNISSANQVNLELNRFTGHHVFRYPEDY